MLRQRLQTPAADLIVRPGKLHADKGAARLEAGLASAAGSHERVEHGAAGGGHFQQFLEQGDGLGRQMEFVPVHTMRETAGEAAVMDQGERPLAGEDDKLALLPEPAFLGPG